MKIKEKFIHIDVFWKTNDFCLIQINEFNLSWLIDIQPEYLSEMLGFDFLH